MSLQITFRRAARAEFIEAAAWYEAQRPNLGAEFIAEIERCVALAAQQPDLYAVVEKDVRRIAARRLVSTSAPKRFESLSGRSPTVGEILRSGRAGPSDYGRPAAAF